MRLGKVKYEQEGVLAQQLNQEVCEKKNNIVVVFFFTFYRQSGFCVFCAKGLPNLYYNKIRSKNVFGCFRFRDII